MKVSAINPSVSARVLSSKRVNKSQSDKRCGFTTISFRGGNSGHVLHVIAEIPPYSKKGGVATVGNDYRTLPNISKDENGIDAFVIPYYNGAVTYDESGELVKSVDVLKVPHNLPDGHQLKGKEGKPIYTLQDLDKKSLDEILLGKEGKDFWVLEEVHAGTMQWGFEENAPIKLFRVPGTNDFMVYTEATASMKEPYQGGGYATSDKPFATSWKGDPYAKFNKAVVEQMEKVTNAVGGGYDPGTVVCSDSHAAYVSHYMAERNANGEGFFQEKKPTQVIHNGGDGYIGKTSPRNMLVNISDKKQLETIIESKEYLDALREGKEDEFLLEILAPVVGKGQKSVSAMNVPIYYAKKGYVPMITAVSEKYAEAVVQNKEIAPSLQAELEELEKEGRFKGIINPLNDPKLGPDKPLPFDGYKQDVEVTLKNGTKTTVKAFRIFDTDKLTDLAHVKEVKNENKLNLFDRLSGKYKGADKESLIIAGKNGAAIEVHGYIDPKYAEKIKAGEDVRLFTSWGRGDFQKAMDVVMDSFVKYVKLTGDENAVFVMGGPLQDGTPDKVNINNKIEEILKMPEMQGRFVYTEGWTPGLAFALAADMANLPSRTAPCELTDLEAIRKLCTPNVSNCQGLAQKNFDPNGPNAELANGYVTEHEHFMSEEVALAAGTGTTAAAALLALKTSLEKAEKEKFKIRTGTEITPEVLRLKVESNDKYQKALKGLRDEVMSTELAGNMERKKNETRETSQKILKNQVEMKTGWENNGNLSKTKKSSGELYRERHFRSKGEKISKTETLIEKIKKTISEKIKKVSETITNVTEGKIKSEGNTGKIITIALVAILTGIALGKTVFNRKNKNAPVQEEEKALSMVG